ncbi:MAG: DUF4230 domain-containing protein [Bacteroidales bacterium]
MEFIKKYWYIFALIALYFILAFTNVLPGIINPFKKKSLVIDDTPVLVKEIKEIGELTTCEFYGEVYADIYEVYDEILDKFKDSIAINPQYYYNDFSGLAEYMSNSAVYKENEAKYIAERQKYETLLNDYKTKLENFQLEQKNLQDELSKIEESKKDRKQIESRMNELKTKAENEKKSFEDSQVKFREYNIQYTKTKSSFWENRKKRNLVYIGRGWVKAGINLKGITEDEIIVETGDSSEIQILISDPIITDADINPWFIYTDDKKVKGYEVFMAKTGGILSDKNFTDKEITFLKHKCKDKLKEAAIDKGILKNAKISAIQTLENFFGMVGFKKVKVRFKSNTIVTIKQ